MARKFKNILKLTPFLLFSTLYPNNSASISNLHYVKNETTIESNDLEHKIYNNITLRNFTEFTRNKEIKRQHELIENALISDVRENNISIDSVSKFVEKEILRIYLRENNLPTELKRKPKTNEDYALNRLNILTFTGEEIRTLRNNSLRNLAKMLGVTPGQVPNNEEHLQQYYNLYREDIKNAAKQNGIRKEFLTKILLQESKLYSFAISPTGALGLGQNVGTTYNLTRPIREEPSIITHTSLNNNTITKELTQSINPFNGQENIYRSAELLGYLMKKYRNETMVKVAYHDGEGTLNKALRFAYESGNKRNYLNQKYPKGEEKAGQYILSSGARAYPNHIKRNSHLANKLFERSNAMVENKTSLANRYI